MGNRHPKQRQGYQNFYSHYSKIHQTKLIPEPDNHIAIQFEVGSVQDYSLLKQTVKQRSKLNRYEQPYFITASFITMLRNQSLSCSPNNAHTLTARIGYCYIQDETLKRIIKVRKNMKKKFTKSEVLYLITQFLSLMRLLHKNRTHHGNIQPSTVFIVKIKGQKMSVCLLDSYFMNEGLTNYQLRLKYPQQSFFLSRQQLTSVKKNKHQHNFRQQDDIFCLGMTLLELVTLQKSMELYDFRHARIYQEQLQQRLQSTGTQYGAQIMKLIRMMLNGSTFNQISEYQREKFTTNEP